MCNPNVAVMDSTIVADADKFAHDKFTLEKRQRKLRGRAERGDITQEQEKDLWKQHGRMHMPTEKYTKSDSTIDANDITSSKPNHSIEQGSITLLSASRGQRKAWQVENFVTLLKDCLLPGMTVIDFGSGSGNLCLALAAYFPLVRFVLVDKKSYPLQLALNRATSAGLQNIQVQQYTFSPNNLQAYAPPPRSSLPPTTRDNDQISTPSKKPFDLGIGLHCCGSFTDMVMELCQVHQADCIVCPCCNGGMVPKSTGGYLYPRSTFMRQCVTEEEYLQQLSKSADDLQNYAAKCYVEYDRALWAQEHGFQKVELWKMTPLECSPKHHVLFLKS